MKFQVVWSTSAESELTRLWLTAGDRPSITAAADRIDSLLRHDPEHLGESCEGNVRIVHEDPLGAEFHVNVGDLRVNVIRVWQFRPRH